MSLSLLLCCAVAWAGTLRTVLSGDSENRHPGPVWSVGGNAASAWLLLPVRGPLSSALDMLVMTSVILPVLCRPALSEEITVLILKGCFACCTDRFLTSPAP